MIVVRLPTRYVPERRYVLGVVLGEWLGLDQDRQLFRFFRRYHLAEFPALGRIHRTTFVRQAANLWRVVAEVTRLLSRELLELDCGFWILDSVSLHKPDLDLMNPATWPAV